MSIPAILGALVLELKDCTAVALSGAEIAYYVVGMIIAAVVGYVCIKTMLIVVRRKKIYRFCHLLSDRGCDLDWRIYLYGINKCNISVHLQKLSWR